MSSTLRTPSLTTLRNKSLTTLRTKSLTTLRTKSLTTLGNRLFLIAYGQIDQLNIIHQLVLLMLLTLNTAVYELMSSIPWWVDIKLLQPMEGKYCWHWAYKTACSYYLGFLKFHSHFSTQISWINFCTLFNRF